jgi:hypothetical protein
MEIINKNDFAVVCSVIDTQYDVIMWEEQKSGHEPPRRCRFHDIRNVTFIVLDAILVAEF